MTPAQQDRRRQLKRRRRELDRIAQDIAAMAPRPGDHAPSTRSKQAKWHHEVAETMARRAAAWQHVRDQMRAIDDALAEIGRRP